MTTPEHHRHWLLELLCWWEGRITPKQLAEHWQVSRQHASSLLQGYLQAHPRILEGEPEAQQLVIVNKDDIKPWLFGGNMTGINARSKRLSDQLTLGFCRGCEGHRKGAR